MNAVRDTVLSSLSAVGAKQEARFYANLFAESDPERFALILIDPRCLKNPLLEALTSGLRILSKLRLTPVLLIGALDDDRTAVRFQAQRLASDLESSGVKALKLNTASYGLISEIRKRTKSGIMPVLEMIERRGPMSLERLIADLRPHKIVSLQPSGGLTLGGVRQGTLRMAEVGRVLEEGGLTVGQVAFLKLVKSLDEAATDRRTYVLASPLNLLAELFTTKGSGTLIRRSATIDRVDTLPNDTKMLQATIDAAFGKALDAAFLKRPIHAAFLDSEMRAGAIFTQLDGRPYLSKFWVAPEAQGEGLAGDVWEAVLGAVPAFFWRSRLENPFNDWYLRACDGMQRSEDWRIFWKGLDAVDIPSAILAASAAPDDFKTR